MQMVIQSVYQVNLATMKAMLMQVEASSASESEKQKFREEYQQKIRIIEDKLGVKRGIVCGNITNEGHAIIDGRGTIDMEVAELRNLKDSILEISLI